MEGRQRLRPNPGISYINVGPLAVCSPQSVVLHLKFEINKRNQYIHIN